MYDIVVSVILIFESFEHVSNNPFLILKTFSWKLYIFPYFMGRRAFTSFHGKKGPLGLEFP
jgi:hypothetical protein